MTTTKTRRHEEFTDPNLAIAALLLDLSEVYRPSARFWGYKNASRSIRRHPDFLSDLSDSDILKIPGVGPASLRVVRELPRRRRIAHGCADSGRERESERD